MDIVFMIVVVSDTVFQDRSRDVSGVKVAEAIRSKGYKVYDIVYIPNSFKEIVRVIMNMLSEVDVAVFIGGTGPSPRDITVDVLESMAWRKLPGFGELFRRISYEIEGAKAILSRAEMYISPEGTILVALPGAPKAVEIGLNILFNVVEHLVKEVRRFEEPHE
jgi:molybdenum cofactor biosynthesis protein B